jgi:hypothetical protein
MQEQEEFIQKWAGKAMVRVHPELDDAVLKLYAEGKNLQAYAESFTVAGLSDMKRAIEDLSMIANLKKALEERRKEYTTSLNSHLHQINDTFKAMVEPIDIADKLLRGKASAFNKEQQRPKDEAAKAEELIRQATEIQAKLTQRTGEIFPGIPTVSVPEVVVSKKVYTSVGDMSTRKNRRYIVTNFSLLPDEYKMEDSTKLGKVVRAGINSIPGVEIYEDESLVVRPKRG